MIEVSDFEKNFFNYQLPLPLVSIYCKQYAKSNDLRLLVEIATKSNLRMFTDPKTNNLHFICKQKGAQCFDVEAHLATHQEGYYFIQDCSSLTHRGNCQQEGISFRYLQIYNLFKLKKDNIEKFMLDNKLMNQSPSLILNKLSNNNDQYFFERYIDFQVELRRKLRKRFDNIVNIDIKKIGKGEEKEDIYKEEGKEQISKLEMSSCKKPSLPLQQKISNIPSPENKNYNKNEIRQWKNDLKTEEKEQKSQEKNKIIKKSLSKKEKKKKKKDKLKKQKLSAQKCKLSLQDIRQSIFILGESKQSKGEEIFIDSKVKQSLPELQMLNEQADYLWSESSQQPSKEIHQRMDNVLEISREDYFNSLRNSTLKKSLEKESLSHFLFFPSQLNKQNYS